MKKQGEKEMNHERYAEGGWCCGGFTGSGSDAECETAEFQRRRANKKEILAEVDAAAGTGNIGEILRREGIYSSTVTGWREERKAGPRFAARRGSVSLLDPHDVPIVGCR